MDEKSQQIVQIFSLIMQAAQSGDLGSQKIIQDIQAKVSELTLKQQQQPQMVAAKNGAKLNYIKHLSGNCPEGTELQYYKVGGRVCKRCMKKSQEGGELDTIEQFKKGRKVACHNNGDNLTLKNDKTRVNFQHHEPLRRPDAPNTGIGHLTRNGWDNEGNYIISKKKTPSKKPTSFNEGDPNAGAPSYRNKKK